MKFKPKNQPSSLEIPQLLGSFGLSQSIPGLMVFDSSVYSSDTIRKRPFRSSHYSIMLVDQGQMQVKVNLIQYTMRQGDLLVIPPSAIREIVWEGRSVHFLSLLFIPEFILASGNYIRSIAQLPLFKNDEQAIVSLSDEGRIIGLQMIELIHLLLIRDKSQQKGSEQILRSAFQATIGQIGQFFEAQSKPVSLNKSIIHRFFDLLVKHYKLQREVSFYAKLLGIHEKYLSQVLKKETGYTARSFIIQMVILEAKVLLDYPSLSVSTIADQLHFQNQFHFSRFFKKYTSETPTEYRNGQS